MRKSRISLEARLFSVPGVVSVGWGYKVKGGKQLDRECIVVGVEKKRRFVWSGHKISNLTSLETDVIEVGKIVALQSRTDKWRPALGGVSIGHQKVSVGTLGCLVRVKGKQGWHVLSNNHVLADCNAGVIGDAIVQPGVADGGDLDYLGLLGGFEPIDFAGGANHADCAIATPDKQEDVSSEILGIGEPTGYGEVQLGMVVQKSGRTTAVTTGTVQQIGVTVQVAYSDNQVAMFHDQILTGCMSQGGDSGSALLDMDRKIVGLLFAGSDVITCYSPIEYVVEALNLDTGKPPPPDEVTKTYRKWGMHGPNKDPTNISSMVSLGMDCYTVVDKWEQVSQIHAARPNALILLRPYFTGGLATDPVVIAQRSCDHAIQFLGKTRHLVVGNELNIEGPFEAHNPDSWKKMNEWVLKTAEVVRQNLPEVILHFPAVSPGVGDDPDIMSPPGLEYCRDAIEECDILDQHCFLRGTLVSQWDGTPVPIEAVYPGMEVIQADGMKGVVTKVFRHAHKGQVIKIKPKGVPRLDCTPEHPFLISRRTKKRKQDQKEFVEEWVSAAQVNHLDYTWMPRRKFVLRERFSADQMWVMGLWIADGHILPGGKANRQGLGFSLNIEEKELAERAVCILEDWFPDHGKSVINSGHKRDNPKLLEMRFGSQGAAYLFEELFGKGARKKHIHGTIMGERYALSLVRGVLDGDGTVKTGRDTGMIFTTSEVLAWQLRQILLDRDVWCRLDKITRESTGFSPPNCKPTSWVIVLPKFELPKLPGHAWPETGRHVQHHIVADDGYLVAVRNIASRSSSSSRGQTTVFNLEVEPGNTFLANGVAVHNCYWPGRSAPSWAWEQRFEEWYGRRMIWHHNLFPSKYIFISECGPSDVIPDGTADDIIEWFNILESEFPYVLGGTLFMWNWGLENDYLSYYNKPKLIGALRDATKRQFESPTNWIFNGDEAMRVKIWRRDLPGSPVVTMEVEAYVDGVVCSEMYCSWLLEALKVQAVAARGYVIYHQEHGGKHPMMGADLCTEPCCQVYNPSNITDKSIRATRETKGITLLHASGKTIQPEYISKCGMPACPFCEGRPGYNDKQWPGRMCQYGAKVSAEQGRSWREILKFYYPHAHLSDEESPSPPPPEEDIAERLLEDLDTYLPPWNEWMGYNPDTALARAARLAQPPLGLPISGELRKQVGSKPIVYQFFWGGLVWCREKEYNNIHIARY